MRQPKVIASVLAERRAQKKQWGGRKHDELHTTNEWCDYIAKQCDKARNADSAQAERDALIKIAALAIAALEVR